MRTKLNVSKLVFIGALALPVGQASASEVPLAAPEPVPECTARVNWDQFRTLPGYWVQDPAGTTCVPFMQTRQKPPEGYKGNFYVDEFTNAAIMAKWAACKLDTACFQAVQKAVAGYGIPHQFRVTGVVDPFGKIEPEGTVDLADIRRPGYFGQAPYFEPIAELESRTYTVEYEVPREPYEQIVLGLTDRIKMRGWYIQGDGVVGAQSNRTHPIVVMVAGRSGETTAIRHPKDFPYTYDPITGKFTFNSWPSATTERYGVGPWRQYLYDFVRAGFDVFTVDKRGHGISGGREDYDTAEQAEDIFRGLDALETGRGLRMLTPTGQVLSGADAAGILLHGLKAKQAPVILGGPSQGSMVLGWAMLKNFDRFCAFNLPGAPCTPPYRYNIKGAISFAPFTSGLGFMGPGSDLVEAALREQYHIMFIPTSEVLSSIPKWPAVFFGKGLWDYAESLQGTLTSYEAAKGLREIAVVRGPHAEGQWGPENMAYMSQRMVEFALRAARNEKHLGTSEPATTADVVDTSPPYYEPSTVPVYQ